MFWGFAKMEVLVGGGQDYYGPTSDRDKRVVAETARALFSRVGNNVRIVTGGMPGIPMDFVKSWLEAGGRHVEFIFSAEAYATLSETDKVVGVTYNVVAQTQSERRQLLTHRPQLKCALFVQGGQYSTDEIIKCMDRGLPTLCFVGSGGACSGAIAYKGYSVDITAFPEWTHNTDPNANASELAGLFAAEIEAML